MASRVSNSVKLVIWDLDETFWGGTLSEGPIIWSEENAGIVQALAARGIVSSICSKNDPTTVSEVLSAHHVSDYFVFSSVTWEPKGPRLKSMLEAMALRPTNCLFIDDNPSNLAECAHYAPGLMVATPDVIPQLLALPQTAGRPDPECSRLEMYRRLESRWEDRRHGGLTDDEFLRQSGIVATISPVAADDLPRIAELVERSNQLNYTKLRSSEEDLRSRLSAGDTEAGVVRVQDAYGDYGLVGFFLLVQGQLEHFVFSCRILNMGVDRWVYSQLGRPGLQIVGEVAGDLAGSEPDWINQQQSPIDRPDSPKPIREALDTAVLLRGSCDMAAVVDFLAGLRRMSTEFNWVSRAGLPVHPGHSIYLTQGLDGAAEEHQDAIAQLPFLEARAFRSAMFDGPFDVVVWSLSADFDQALYRRDGSDFRVAWGDFDCDNSTPSEWEALIERYGSLGLTRAFLERFRAEYSFEGPIDPSELLGNLDRIRSALQPETLLILINGAEAVSERFVARHQAMNASLDAWIARNRNVHLCDMRAIVNSEAQVTDYVSHYSRQVYLSIAHDLMTAITAHTGSDSIRLRSMSSARLRAMLHIPRSWLSAQKARMRALRNR